MGKLVLKAVEEKIRGKSLTTSEITSTIRRAAFDNEKIDFCDWIIRNNYFNKPWATLFGINESNKWSLLKNELANNFLKNKQPFLYSYCFELRKSKLPEDILKKFNLSIEELCLLAGYSEAIQLNFSTQPILILKWARFTNEFNLNVASTELPNNLNIQDSTHRNDKEIISLERCAFAFDEQIKSELTRRHSEATSFQKFLIQSSLHNYDKNILNEFNLRDKNWAHLMLKCISDLSQYSFKSNKYNNPKSKLYKWIRESDSNLIIRANNSYVEGVVCYKILQTRLHYNLELDLTYKELVKFKPIENYVKGICQIGILDAEEMSRKFKWPELKEISKYKYTAKEDFFSSFNENSPLTALSYHVGENGEREEVRRKILSSLFEGKSGIENQLAKSWEESWGSPNSAIRLEKIVYHIHRQTINKKSLGYQKAVEDWSSDLEYLKKLYYESSNEIKQKFKYPDND